MNIAHCSRRKDRKLKGSKLGGKNRFSARTVFIKELGSADHPDELAE
jgi:hypothetical protein